MRILLIISVACLALGLGLIFGYCNGSTNFDFAYPLASTKLHLDITTTGAPALFGVLLSVIGVPLLATAWVIALLRTARRRRIEDSEESTRHGKPFVG